MLYMLDTKLLFRKSNKKTLGLTTVELFKKIDLNIKLKIIDKLSESL